MNEEINTVSEEQVLHNKLSFGINQELIHLMKRIVELQQENARLKDKVENATKLVEEIKLHYQQSPTMIPNVKINKLEDLLKEN